MLKTIPLLSLLVLLVSPLSYAAGANTTPAVPSHAQQTASLPYNIKTILTEGVTFTLDKTELNITFNEDKIYAAYQAFVKSLGTSSPLLPEKNIVMLKQYQYTAILLGGLKIKDGTQVNIATIPSNSTIPQGCFNFIFDVKEFNALVQAYPNSDKSLWVQKLPGLTFSEWCTNYFQDSDTSQT
jgi:hypothetical protein